LPTPPPFPTRRSSDLHHHPQQKRRAAPPIQERVALDDLRLELLPRFVRVDRLVLGRVVLEDAAEIGKQRDQGEIEHEDRDADQRSEEHTSELQSPYDL